MPVLRGDEEPWFEPPKANYIALLRGCIKAQMVRSVCEDLKPECARDGTLTTEEEGRTNYTVTLLLVDEAAFIRADGDDGDSDAITAVLPMLTDDGVAIFASTPAGRTGYFAELFSNKQPGIHRIVVKGTDIPRLAARCARLKSVLSPTKYRQEVLVEMLGAGTSYFDISAIEKAINPDVEALRLC